MARQNYREIKVKGHYNTYTVGNYKDGYKQVQRWIPDGTRKIKKVFMITQKKNVKDATLLFDKTMVKTIPQNIIDSIKALVKSSDYEYSIDLDFERHLESPEQMLVMKGGKRQTLKHGDFEIFGHSHPSQKYPLPSNTDLKNLRLLKPEFLVARTGRAIIMNVEDWNKWRDYKESDKKADTGWATDEYGRNRLFEQTGVRIYPLTKELKIEMIDDPIKEKRFPRASPYYLAEWETES